MMNKIKIAFMVCMGIHISGLTQSKEYNFDLIKTPTSPAFTILGVAPTEISRPKTFDALETSIFNDFADSTDILLPANYALEFMPYWLTSHPSLSFDKYIDPSLGQSIIQNLSISIATSRRDDDSLGTDLGLGIRTQLIQGKPTPKFKSFAVKLKSAQITIAMIIASYKTEIATKDYLNSQDAISKIIELKDKLLENNNLVKEVIEFAFDEISKKISELDGEITVNNLETVLDNINNEIVEISNLKLISKKIDNAITDREGFSMEIAAAFKYSYPSNKLSNSEMTKFGLWLTPRYQFREFSEFEILGLFRYIKDEQRSLDLNVKGLTGIGFENDYIDNIDLGVKLVYKKARFSLMAEAIYRNQSLNLSRQLDTDPAKISASVDETEWKWNINLGYRLSETVMLNYTYGKNFDLNTELNGDLISAVSLNFGFGIVQNTDFN